MSLNDQILNTIKAARKYLSARQLAAELCEDADIVLAALESLEAENRVERRGRHVWGIVGLSFPRSLAAMSHRTVVADDEESGTVSSGWFPGERVNKNSFRSVDSTQSHRKSSASMSDVLANLEKRMQTPPCSVSDAAEKCLFLERLATILTDPGVPEMLLSIRDDIRTAGGL